MVLKHLLLGLGGSVAIGGIGYGIYSSSQSSVKENAMDAENSVYLGGNLSNQEGSGSKAPSGGKGEDSKNLQKQEAESNKTGQEGAESGQKLDTNGAVNNSETTPGNTSPQPATPPEGGEQHKNK